jgi:hypothetical protein
MSVVATRADMSTADTDTAVVDITAADMARVMAADTGNSVVQS